MRCSSTTCVCIAVDASIAARAEACIRSRPEGGLVLDTLPPMSADEDGICDCDENWCCGCAAVNLLEELAASLDAGDKSLPEAIAGSLNPEFMTLFGTQ